MGLFDKLKKLQEQAEEFLTEQSNQHRPEPDKVERASNDRTNSEEKKSGIKHIDFHDNIMDIDGTELKFPLSAEEVVQLFGQPETAQPRELVTEYVFHEQGIVFTAYKDKLNQLKKCKVYTDDAHCICSVMLYCGDSPRTKQDGALLPRRNCQAKITVRGLDPYFISDRNETDTFHLIRWSKEPNAPNGRATTMNDPLSVSFTPKNPRGQVSYKLKPCNEETLTFTTFNFKLAIIQVLMYELEVLEPYFDIYDFADQYSGKEINTDSETPIRPAVNFFKKIEIPKRLAEKVEEINMDGGNDIYMNIAPQWNGEDDSFDLIDITVEELKQFPNLKKATIMSGQYDKVAKVFAELGIDTERA